MKVHKSKFTFGDLVFLITDIEQLERMITGVKFFPGGIIYTLASGTSETFHYEMEISSEKDTLKQLTQ